MESNNVTTGKLEGEWPLNVVEVDITLKSLNVTKKSEMEAGSVDTTLAPLDSSKRAWIHDLM